jgi:PAS domain S-box-containing protein
VALLAVAAAVLLRWLLDPWLEDQLTLVTLYGAVAVAVWVGGFRPALVAVAVGYFACDYLFIQPRGVLFPWTPRNLLGFVAYLASCSIIIGFGEALRATRRRAEATAEAAARDREWLRTTLASVGDAVVTTDAKGYVTFLNPLAQSMTGWNEAEAVGQPLEAVFEIVDEQTRRPAEPPVAKVLQEGLVVGLANHTVLIARDGSERAIDDSAAPIKDGNGSVQGVILVFRDVTDRAKAERRRAARLAVTQLLAEAATVREAAPRLLQSVCESLGWDIGTLWRVDENARALRCVEVWHRPTLSVPRFEATTRQRAFEPGVGLPGRVWSVGAPAWIPDVAKDDNFPRAATASGEGLHAAFGFPVLLGAEVLGVIEFFSHAIREPDADLLEMMATIGGQVGQFLERRRAEEGVRRQNERLRLLWEAASVLLSTDEPDAMLRGLFAKIAPHFGLDPYFNFMVNDAGDGLRLQSCLGIPEEAARSIARLEFGEALCGTVAVPRQPVVATRIQQSDDPEAQLVKSFGIRAYAWNPLLAGDRLLGTLSFASRSRDEFDAEEVDFLRTICQYVTATYERLRLIGQLLEADRRKDEFLATLAHELRNPLAPIRNALEIMRLAEDDGQAVGDARGLMERQLGQMVRLIDDMLDVSRITRGKLQLRRERIELAAVVNNAVETSRPLIEAAGHELSVILPPGPVHLDADPTRLAQVFANLLNNAAKFTNPGGRICLTAERQGGDVVVSVRDNGIGIPADRLPRLFEIFSQVAPALERSRGGLGIGLSLVKGLVEMHGGSVEGRSGGSGRGSEFLVRLPVSAEAPADGPARPGDPEGPAAPARCRILVVDDLRDAADTLALLLQMRGHDVRAARDGLEAVAAAEAFLPEVVLLDIGLPKLNGYQAARRIRQQPWGRGMTLVALTGWGQEEDKRRASEAGFDHHLTKPVDPAALEELLAELQQYGPQHRQPT